MTVATAAPARGPAAPQRRPARSRRWIGLVVLLALTVVACLASIAIGTRSIGLGEVWRALLDSGLASEEAVIVRQLRVPRTVLGLMVGMALGVAGALMQGHTRNPLGDPGLLGVTAGASLAVVLSIAWLGISAPSGYVWFAFLGALAGTVAVYADRLGRPRRRHPGHARAGRGRAVGAALRAGPRRPGHRPADAGHLPLLGGRLAGRPGRRRRRGRWPRSSPSACCSRVVNAPGAQPARPRRGRRPRAGPADLARPGGRAGRDHAARRRGDGGLRAHRVRRPGRAARRPRRHRPRPPLADPVLRAWPAPSCCSPPTSSAGWSCGPASSRSGIVLALIGAPFFIALVRRRKTVGAVTVEAAPRPAPAARGRHVVRVGPVSGVVRWRHLVVPLAAFVVLVLLSAVSLGRGDFPIGVPDVLRTLVGLGEGAQDFIILELRAPRIVVGLLVGLALGRRRRAVPDLRPQPAGLPRHPRHHRWAPRWAPSRRIVLSGGSGGARSAASASRWPRCSGALLHRRPALPAHLAGRHRRLPAGAGRHRALVGRAPRSSTGCSPTPRSTTPPPPTSGSPARSTPAPGSTPCRWPSRWPCSCPLALAAEPGAAASSSSATTPPAGSASGCSRPRRPPCCIAVGCVAFAVSAAGPITFVALVVPQIAVRLTGGSRPAAAGLRRCSAPCWSSAPTWSPAPCSPRRCRWASSPPSSARPYLLWLLVRGRRQFT